MRRRSGRSLLCASALPIYATIGRGVSRAGGTCAGRAVGSPMSLDPIAAVEPMCAAGEAIRSLAMGVIVRAACRQDGAGISRAWLNAASYYANLDADHFQVPRAEGLAESFEAQISRAGDRSLQLVGEIGRLAGWLAARMEPLDRTLQRSSPASMAGPGW